ncbi:MAG: hypothetical protein P8Y82_02635 [Methyloceanibacter sp.]
MDRPVFVFGSDIAGHHADGDSLVALRTRGAVYGQGSGPQGNAYAIPTRSRTGRPRTRQDIAESVSDFLGFTRLRPWALFDVAPMFAGAPHNVTLPAAFHRILARRIFDNRHEGEAI